MLEGRRVAFLSRHGTGHRLLPREIPQLANFWALKHLGVRRVAAVSAVGSLQAAYRPGDMVIPDQIIDRTRHERPETYFGDGVVCHVSLAEPFDAELRAMLASAVEEAGGVAHRDGSYVVIDGPAFGTRAESELYRSWGAAVVGMTALPEAKLAREAEMDYAMLTAVTDYDSWNTEAEAVEANAVFAVLAANVQRSQETIRALVRRLPEDGDGGGTTVLDSAMVTAPDAIADEAYERIGPILARWSGGKK